MRNHPICRECPLTDEIEECDDCDWHKEGIEDGVIETEWCELATEDEKAIADAREDHEVMTVIGEQRKEDLERAYKNAVARVDGDHGRAFGLWLEELQKLYGGSNGSNNAG